MYICAHLYFQLLQSICQSLWCYSHYQLTTKFVEKCPTRHRTPHFLCGSLSEEESAIIVSTPLPEAPLTLNEPVVNVREKPKSKQAKRTNDKKAKPLASNDQPLGKFLHFRYYIHVINWPFFHLFVIIKFLTNLLQPFAMAMIQMRILNLTKRWQLSKEKGNQNLKMTLRKR